MKSKLQAYWELARLDRPIGTFLLLWPTLAALWLAAKGLPPIKVIIAFVLGTFVMRACGCVINDIADRNFDPHVQRTRHRPLADGRLSVREAFGCFVGLAVAGLCIVFLMLNVVTWLLACGGLLITLIYPFLKRFTHLPQLVLGVAFSWGILMADTAINSTVTLEISMLFVASFFWIVAYDTEYAMVDRDDDLKLGLKSIAILFGKFDCGAVILLETITLLILCVVGFTMSFSFVYYVGIGLIGSLFVYQWVLLQSRERSKCFRAFLNNGWVGFVMFLTYVAEFAWVNWAS